MTRAARLRVVLALNLALVAGLVTAGLTAHSLAVFAAGVDYLADAAAIGVALLAIWLRQRPPSARHPAGYPRATAYAALLNAALLLAVVVSVIVGAVRRLLAGAGEVHGLTVVVAGGVAAVAMLAGGLLLARDEPGEDDSEGDRANIRAAVLDTLADSASAAGVAVTGAVILAAPSLSWLDPAASLVISMVIGYHALALVRTVARSLRRPPGARTAAGGPAPQREG